MPNPKKLIGCHVETTLAVVGGRWKVLVLFYLLDGTRRFNELHRLLGGISNRTLVRQLRELENDGILTRTQYPEIPPRVEYALTPLGRSLGGVLRAMHEWGESYDRHEKRPRTKPGITSPMALPPSAPARPPARKRKTGGAG